VEVKIGVQNVARELVIDTSLSPDDVEKAVSKALSGDEAVLTLEDSKGRKLLVPSDKLAYVEVGAPSAGTVGYRL
jgi:hypothetical protein